MSRRLALVPDPHPGESVLSWADALARLNQVSRTEALRMAGLVSSSTVSAVFGYRVSDVVVRAVRESTGMAGEQLRSMTLAHYAGRVLEALPRDDAKEYGAWATWRYRQRMVLPKHSNACPSCLRENGGRWLVRWRLAWSFACVRHQRYLIAQCSGCGSFLHRVWPGGPKSWICPGASRGLGLRPPPQPCGRDIRRMRAKPVHDAGLLACQQRIDHLLDGPQVLTADEARDLFRELHHSMQDVWSAVRPLRLPPTDEAVHRAWERHLAPGGYREQYRPLLVAAAMKIATEAGLETAEGIPVQAGPARPNWDARQPGQGGEVALAANRFGSRCRHSGCFAWVPAGHGVVLGDTDGRDTHCPRHAQAFTRRAQSREHTGPAAFTEPYLMFLDDRLREEEQGVGEVDGGLPRQRIEAQRLILDACAATAPRTREGRSLRYAVRCLLLPYAGHADFRMAWLPRQGENPARPIVVEGSAGEASRGAAGRG
ncbi:TniQ family protein [Streptomyces sp. G1]|uniref:TniQ family protein n=1 Tax=Streptomyces sp. G1 TaxID=361572 RepID=UPI00202EEFC6|nr:DUF6221 family protein [Streptomyces sp. G1]MCM1964799.1 TniQ family protein [Streptomyces sp. G1]